MSDQKPNIPGAKETIVDGALDAASSEAASVKESVSSDAASAKETMAEATSAVDADVELTELADVNADVDAEVELSELADVDADVELSELADAAVAPAAIARFDTAAMSHRVAADGTGRTLSEADFKKRSRRSVLTGGVGALAAFVGWRTLQARPVDDRIPDVLRAGHELNEGIWKRLFRSGAEAPTFDYSKSSMMRVNGRHGIRDPLDLASWELTVLGRDGQVLGTHQVEDLRAMPQTELTVEHKCVEGWAHIVTWGGVRFSEFVEKFYPDEAQANFVGLSTPDGDFNVGLEMEAMMHTQTLLTLDLQREPLSEEHGAPVRLSTPLKYGTKQIKRIGTLQFSDTQPENDYWTVRGYDWYAGL